MTLFWLVHFISFTILLVMAPQIKIYIFDLLQSNKIYFSYDFPDKYSGFRTF